MAAAAATGPRLPIRRRGRGARRPKRCKLATNARLREAVAVKLGEDWSPQQIAGWLVRTFPDESEMWVSHETIYPTLFVPPRCARA